MPAGPEEVRGCVITYDESASRCVVNPQIQTLPPMDCNESDGQTALRQK